MALLRNLTHIIKYQNILFKYFNETKAKAKIGQINKFYANLKGLSAISNHKNGK